MTTRQDRWNTLLDSVHGVFSYSVGPTVARPRIALQLVGALTSRPPDELRAHLQRGLEAVRAWRVGVVDEWIGGGVLHHGVAQHVVVRGLGEALFSPAQ